MDWNLLILCIKALKLFELFQLQKKAIYEQVKAITNL